MLTNCLCKHCTVDNGHHVVGESPCVVISTGNHVTPSNGGAQCIQGPHYTAGVSSEVKRISGCSREICNR